MRQLLSAHTAQGIQLDRKRKHKFYVSAIAESRQQDFNLAKT